MQIRKNKMSQIRTLYSLKGQKINRFFLCGDVQEWDSTRCCLLSWLQMRISIIFSHFIPQRLVRQSGCECGCGWECLVERHHDSFCAVSETHQGVSSRYGDIERKSNGHGLKRCCSQCVLLWSVAFGVLWNWRDHILVSRCAKNRLYEEWRLAWNVMKA
jgi:hypothetical protein